MALQSPSPPALPRPVEPALPADLVRVRPRRDAIGAALVVFVASALGIAVMWYFATEAQWTAARNELMQVARIAATRIDGHAHRAAAAAGHAEGAEAQRLLSPLIALVRASDDVSSIHTAVELDGRFHHVLDTRSAYRVPGDSRASFGSLRPHVGADADQRRALDAGVVTISASPRETPSGRFLTAYAPLTDSAGRVAGVVGVDMGLRMVDARAARLDRVTLAALGVALALSIVAGLVVLPLRRVAAAAEAHDRQTALALAAARDAAEQSSRAKATFVAMMSHELRTPLNAIVGYSELMYDELTRRRQDRLAADIQQVQTAGMRLADIITDILDFSKMDADRLALSPELVEVPALMREVDARVRPDAEAKGLALAMDVAPGVRAVMADPDRLRQVLTNLLRNAVKFTAGGQIVVRVRAASGEVPRVVWSVHDTGQGIPADKRGLLFQPFSQVDGSLTRAAGGTGLGLVISHRLVTAMGGTLTVRSRVGHGSTFRVSLPRGCARRLEAA